MSKKWHISKDMKIRECHATVGVCSAGVSQGDHYKSFDDAQNALELLSSGSYVRSVGYDLSDTTVDDANDANPLPYVEPFSWDKKRQDIECDIVEPMPLTHPGEDTDEEKVRIIAGALDLYEYTGARHDPITPTLQRFNDETDYSTLKGLLKVGRRSLPILKEKLDCAYAYRTLSTMPGVDKVVRLEEVLKRDPQTRKGESARIANSVGALLGWRGTYVDNSSGTSVTFSYNPEFDTAHFYDENTMRFYNHLRENGVSAEDERSLMRAFDSMMSVEEKERLRNIDTYVSSIEQDIIACERYLSDVQGEMSKRDEPHMTS